MASRDTGGQRASLRFNKEKLDSLGMEICHNEEGDSWVMIELHGDSGLKEDFLRHCRGELGDAGADAIVQGLINIYARECLKASLG